MKTDTERGVAQVAVNRTGKMLNAQIKQLRTQIQTIESEIARLTTIVEENRAGMATSKEKRREALCLGDYKAVQRMVEEESAVEFGIQHAQGRISYMESERNRFAHELKRLSS